MAELSSVSVHPDCVTMHEKCKSATEGTLGYVIYQIVKDQVVVKDTCPREGFSYQKYYDYVMKELKEPCYATIVLDADKPDKDGVMKSKIVFMVYVANDAPVKNRMLYSSTKSTLEKALQGIDVRYQANDAAEMDIQEVMAYAFR